MIYIRAGLFAEGRTDYEVLMPLLDRLLDDLGARLFPGAYEVAATVGIDAPRGFEGSRAERIAVAIHDAWDECTLFVVHADGEGEPSEARKRRVTPGIDAARASRPERPVLAAGCLPVREMEAWMLADPEVFRALCGSGVKLELPVDPEREENPKSCLRRSLVHGGLRRQPEGLYAFFGERVRLDALRALPAFAAFRVELMQALRELGGQARGLS